MSTVDVSGRNLRARWWLRGAVETERQREFEQAIAVRRWNRSARVAAKLAKGAVAHEARRRYLARLRVDRFG